MRAHLVQLDIQWEEPGANFDRVKRLLTGVRPSDLVVLPEMFDSGFSLNTETTADKGATLAFLSDLARGLRAYVQGGRTVLPAGATHAHNRAPIFGPGGGLIAEFSKVHPFSFGRETERFVGGTDVLTYEWKTDGACLKVCPAICYDLRFPELFRIGLAKGAEVFALGANWPEARQAHWRALLIARAIENQACVLAVNRTGRDPNLNYIGGTIAVGPRGEIMGELGADEGVLCVDVDPGSIGSWRETFPAWKDVKLMNG